MSEDGGEVTGPWADKQERGEEAARTDFSVTSGHHRVKTTHARASLSGEEDMVETLVTVMADHERLHEQPPLSLSVKTTDKGMLEGLANAELTIEEAEDLHERLGKAISAAKRGDKYYER